ncbi:MAG: sulfur carrier protein ThiS [Chthoniobacteraceae bacterium]
MKKIIVNGQPHNTSAADIAALVAELGFANGTVLIEHNGTALRPAEWKDRALQTGDRIELMRLAAGG